HCTFGAAVKTCKETLLRKASDLTAHVAEVGLTVRGLRPSDTSQWVYRQSATRFESGWFFCAPKRNGCRKKRACQIQ
ncbi:MAG: hypothetical protein IJ354_05955, partial [Clostridia bacterium]|nr:hypothetical protein [Clostridia bacterium]